MGSSCSCISTDSTRPSQSTASSAPAPVTAAAPVTVTPPQASNPQSTATPAPTTVLAAESSLASQSQPSTSNPSRMSSLKPKVAVIYYSTWGHIYKMAQAVVKGVEEAGGDVTLYQIAETLPEDVLKKMWAAPKADHPIVKVDDLPKYDALIFGAPTRYGIPCAQYKALWDATGALWQSGALNGKLASFFTGSATQGGGQETTAMTNMGHFVHHGMIFVPLGYGNPSMFSLDEVHGGSPWCAGTYSAPDGKRQPTELELGLAQYQGKRVTEFAATFVAGKAALTK